MTAPGVGRVTAFEVTGAVVGTAGLVGAGGCGGAAGEGRSGVLWV